MVFLCCELNIYERKSARQRIVVSDVIKMFYSYAAMLEIIGIKDFV